MIQWTGLLKTFRPTSDGLGSHLPLLFQARQVNPQLAVETGQFMGVYFFRESRHHCAALLSGPPGPDSSQVLCPTRQKVSDRNPGLYPALEEGIPPSLG